MAANDGDVAPGASAAPGTRNAPSALNAPSAGSITAYLIFLAAVTTSGPLQFGYHLVRRIPSSVVPTADPPGGAQCAAGRHHVREKVHRRGGGALWRAAAVHPDEAGRVWRGDVHLLPRRRHRRAGVGPLLDGARPAAGDAADDGLFRRGPALRGAGAQHRRARHRPLLLGPGRRRHHRRGAGVHLRDRAGQGARAIWRADAGHDQRRHPGGAGAGLLPQPRPAVARGAGDGGRHRAGAVPRPAHGRREPQVAGRQRAAAGRARDAAAHPRRARRHRGGGDGGVGGRCGHPSVPRTKALGVDG